MFRCGFQNLVRFVVDRKHRMGLDSKAFVEVKMRRLHLLLLFALFCFARNAFGAEPPSEEVHSLGTVLPLWSIIPFAGILLSIALFPLLAPAFWHHHFPKVSLFFGLLLVVPFIVVYKTEGLHEVLHIFIVDYIPFLILLWGLYTIAGGIYVSGAPAGTPKVNFAILLIGTFFASWIGTTGAAMVTVRPLLRANANRRHKAHTVVFFIFMVANIGGSLTPLGDPPLFLGFLHGVPFFWTLFHIFPETLATVVLLSVIYFVLDSFYYSRETREGKAEIPHEKLKIEGAHNLLFLVGVVLGVLFSGSVRLGDIKVLGIERQIETLVRDGIIILMGALSLLTTNKATRYEKNQFTWFPIKEVAILFASIFATIIPALLILQAGEKGALSWLLASVSSPAHYFWAAGALSSFLDNAPTYLTFFNSALGKLGITEQQVYEALRGAKDAMPEGVLKDFQSFLAAISAGAVFMGANTYIGNAPNFMVRSIAEEQGIEMPSFFGYMFKYSIPILIPTFILLTFVFFD